MSKSIIGFLRRSYLMVGLFGWPEEKNVLIDNPLARATTPDDIIEAACINSIARDFDAWKRTCVRDGTKTGNAMGHHIDGRYIYSSMCLANEAKNIRLTWEENSYSDSRKNYQVNGIVFPDKNGYAIVSTYENLRMERARAKAKADAALAEMKRLEGAWDLAENLLGLKRNEFGALVPVDTLEGCRSLPTSAAALSSQEDSRARIRAIATSLCLKAGLCVGARPDKMCYCGSCKGKKRAR